MQLMCCQSQICYLVVDSWMGCLFGVVVVVAMVAACLRAAAVVFVLLEFVSAADSLDSVH